MDEIDENGYRANVGIVLSNAESAVLLGGLITVVSGEFIGLLQRFGKVEVLVAVQGIVMDEILNRRLARQDMVEMGYGGADLLADVGTRRMTMTHGE